MGSGGPAVRMPRRSKRMACALALALGVALGQATEARYVPARDYLATALTEIGRAKKSIVVGMYIFALRHEGATGRLADALAAARQRGVTVEVLLDQNTAYDAGDPVEGKNRAAHDYLKSRGVDVAYDDPATYTHTKALVVDEETVLIGSTNWSESALTRNAEGNVLVRSKDVARDALNALRAATRAAPAPENDTVELPAAFVERRDLFGAMVRRKDERALDTYLFLVESGSAGLDDADLADHLGLGETPRADRRRQMAKTLRKLRDRYGLISFDEGSGDARPLLRSTATVAVPRTYWTLGWGRRLGLAEKTFFFIGLVESARSRLRPRWSVHQSVLARRYGVSAWAISKGLTGLRRKNLVEADYSPLPAPGQPPRRPTLYTPNELYDPAIWEWRWAALEKRHGDGARRARALAALVYEDSDLIGVEELIGLEKERGPEALRRAAAVLGAKSPDNPRRTLAYLIGVARGIKSDSNPRTPPRE